MKISGKKPRGNPLGVEVSQGASNGTCGSFGVAIPLVEGSAATEVGENFFTLRYKNTSIRIVLGNL